MFSQNNLSFNILSYLSEEKGERFSALQKNKEVYYTLTGLPDFIKNV